jgi:hypothetical protein
VWPVGFFDGRRLHIMRTARFSDTVHEALHAISRRNPRGIDVFGRFWEEGMTDWLTQRAVGPYVTGMDPYAPNVRFVEEMAIRLGDDRLDRAFLRGEPAPLMRALRQRLGGQEAAEDFVSRLVDLDPSTPDLAEVEALLAMLAR